MSKNWNDADLLHALHLEQEDAFIQMYTRYYSSVKYFIIKNSGQSADAEDIFQEALFQLVIQLRKDGFVIHTSLQAYLTILVRNIWFKKIRDKKEYSTEFTGEMEGEAGSLEQKVALDNRLEVMEKVLQQELKEDCREILVDYYYKKHQLKEIARRLALTEQFIKVKKHRCMEYLAGALAKAGLRPGQF